MIGVDTKLVLKQSHKPHSIIDRIARKVLECEGDFDIDLRSFVTGMGTTNWFLLIPILISQ